MKVLADGRPGIRACLKIARDAAGWDFGMGRGGASPQRAVTQATTKVRARQVTMTTVEGLCANTFVDTLSFANDVKPNG